MNCPLQELAEKGIISDDSIVLDDDDDDEFPLLVLFDSNSTPMLPFSPMR